MQAPQRKSDVRTSLPETTLVDLLSWGNNLAPKHAFIGTKTGMPILLKGLKPPHLMV